MEKMKKYLLVFTLLLSLVLAACGGEESKESKDGAKETNEIVVGASSQPHAEILEEIKPLLEEEGITLTIEHYQDYVLPNDDLENKTLDANFFQHLPFLEQTVADTGYEIESLGGIHIEPMGVYSKDIGSLDEIKDKTEVILSNSVADHGRVLALFEAEGLIKLDETVKKAEATLDDITENKKNLKFSPDYEPALLPEFYQSEKDVLVAINTNYAMTADLNPLEDALFIEGDESPYVNIIAVRSEDKENQALKTLVDVLHSEETQNFILDKYEGAVVPVSK